MIIDDKYLNDSEIVYICRVFSFIDNKGNEKSIVTKIPFKYKKINENFDISKYSYPLSHVFTTIDDSEVTIAKMDEEHSNEYYLTYCKDELFNNYDTITIFCSCKLA